MDASALARPYVKRERGNIFSPKLHTAPDLAWLYVTLAGSLLLRYSLLDFESGDYVAFLSPWYDFLVKHGRWQGLPELSEKLANYPPLYLYLLSLSTWLPIPKICAIKSISIAADYLAACYVWRLVRRARPSVKAAWAGVSLFLFLPTVVMNGALWGQCDILFTAGLLASLFYLLEGRPVAALVAFGFSASLKPQAIFWCPLLVGLVVSRRLNWRRLWVPVAVYVACGVPQMPAGQPVGRVLWHWARVDNVPGLTLGATNWYQWVFEQEPEILWWPGVVLALVAAAWFVLWMGDMGTTGRRDNETTGRHIAECGMRSADCAMRSQRPPTAGHESQIAIRSAPNNPSIQQSSNPPPGGRGAEQLVSFALLSVMFPPFLLPGMHERYFFAADVLAVIYAFYVAGGWRVTVLVQFASAFTYLPYLFGHEPVPRPFLALAMLAAIGLVVRQLVLTCPRPLTADFADAADKESPRDRHGPQLERRW